MAKPLRFRVDRSRWDEERVRTAILADLDDNMGATMSRPWYKLGDPYTARRFDMDNGDTALFAWRDDVAYWLGNTETPAVLWRTDKVDLEGAPEAISEWAQREFMAELYEDEPWLRDYPALARFFLPVLSAKDGREVNRQFFRDHAAGFPDTERDVALSFYESLFERGVLDQYRHTMAAKLGTSDHFDRHRMAATMSEFTVAKLLSDAEFTIEPEAAVSSGHDIDYRVTRGQGGTLVEVTRPTPPGRRAANTPGRAIRETVETKTADQLDVHGGGVTLFVDCSSFPDAGWRTLMTDRPDVGHRPAVIFRVRPGEQTEGYTVGGIPLGMERLVEES